MIIEAVINDRVVSQCPVEDKFLVDSEDLSRDQNWEMRERIVQRYVQEFREYNEEIFRDADTIRYRLVFKSKMNF